MIQERYKDKIVTAQQAVKTIKPGDTIFIGTGCAQPQHLVNALAEHSGHISDANIIQLLTIGDAPYAHEKYADKFHTNSFFVSENLRDVINRGIGDYTPIFLSDIPKQFDSGRIPIDIALISVTAPDDNGLCSLGVSIDIVKSAVANAKYVIAQINRKMPKTCGDSFIHTNRIDMMVVQDEDKYHRVRHRPSPAGIGRDPQR